MPSSSSGGGGAGRLHAVIYPPIGGGTELEREENWSDWNQIGQNFSLGGAGHGPKV